VESLFIISIVLIFYTYIGYPLILAIIHKLKSASTVIFQGDGTHEELTVVMAMYNAQERISTRLANILQTKYPLEKLHLIVVSDGSTDDCYELAKAFYYPRLTVLNQENNQGKAQALNLAMQHVKTPLVAFADVRQNFDENTLNELASQFSHSDIGAVTGNLMIEQNQELGASDDPGLYWKYEKFIRLNEGLINSVVGVTGAIYMMRSSLFQPLPPSTILDDVFTPMTVVKQGKRVVMAKDAYAFDYSSHSINEEFNRKVRTLAGNYQLMKLLPWLNNPIYNPIFLQWFSHKVCRLIIPFALIAIFSSSLLLDGLFFQLCFIAQFIFYTLAGVGYLKMSKGQSAGILSLPATFTILNIAAFIALFKYFLFSPKKLWKKH
jgi:biofilm PGA synthesis N-glycosyltransferase PgaC